MKLTVFILIAGFCFTAMAEPSKVEKQLFNVGKNAMEDTLYGLAEAQFQTLLEKFPGSDYREEAVCLLAQAMLNRWRWQEARDLLESRLSATSPAWQDSYYFWIGEALLKGEMYDEACKTYEQLVARHPRSRHLADARYGMARALLQQQKFEAAQEILKGLLKEGGRKSPKANLAMAYSFHLQTNDGQAVEILTRLAKEERNSSIGFQALYALGEIDMERKKMDSARERFEALTKSDRSEARSVAPAAFSRLGQIEVGAGAWAAAPRQFEQAFGKSDDPSFRLKCVDEMIAVYLKLDKPNVLADKLRDWAGEHAKTRLGEALLLDVAVLWQRAGKRDQAMQAFQSFFEKYPDGALNDRAHFQFGWVFLEDKKYETAISEFQKAAERSKSPQLQAEAWLKIGDLQFERQQYDEAASAYARCAQVKNADPAKTEQALYLAANSSFKFGNHEDALKFQQRHAAQFPSGKLAPDFLLLLAETHRKKGAMDKVAESYKNLLDKYPDSSHAPKAWFGYAEALYTMGKFKESMSAVESFVEKFPKNELTSRAMQLHARALERLDQTDKAVAEFESLVKLYPNTTAANESQFWLGSYFHRQKNYAKSQEQFELLLKNSPGSPLAPEAAYYAAFSADRLDQKKEDAARLIKQLVQNYPASPWVFDARLLHADILNKYGDFQGALLTCDDLIKGHDPAKNPSLAEQILEVHGRRGQCLRQLKRYEEAGAAFKIILDSPKPDATTRNHAWVELGKTYENMKDTEKALENYLAPLYNKGPQSPRPDEREFFWIGKGGFEAERLLEEQKDWKGAARVLKRMIESNLPLSWRKKAEERLKALQAEHSDAN